MKKSLALILALVMAVLCGAAFAEDYPEKVEGIDLGGRTIYIYDYWTSEAQSKRKADPTEEEQATYDYRDWIEATYNCKIVQIQKGGWGDNVNELINFVTAPDDTLCVYILPPDFVGSPMNNNYFMPWDERILANEKWNEFVCSFMTKGGQVYGVYPGATEPRQCLFFNKTVLENAGIEWETIYDMQADGTWTWEAFEEMLAKIQQDTNNDGVVDIWALTGNNSDFYLMGAFSNNGSFFELNENEELVVTANKDETVNGLNWAKRVWSEYAFPQPADSQWNYFVEDFKAGERGFLMYQTYGGFNDNAEISGTEFEWGCVAFPMGPSGDRYVTINSDNVTVMPNVYDAETAYQIQFIYDLYTNVTPGYDDEDAWIGNKYNYTDDRAVDETYAMLRDDAHVVANNALSLGAINDVLGRPLLWNISWREPAELIEEAMDAWQAMCDTYNGK
ncbi:MAG: hypothetical protein IKR85_12075 [Clostridia bacterium]|nr:hypothetical protein [Clostridia bacterium]